MCIRDRATAATSPEAPATPAVNSNGAVPEMNSPAMSTGTIMAVSYTHLASYTVFFCKK